MRPALLLPTRLIQKICGKCSIGKCSMFDFKRKIPVLFSFAFSLALSSALGAFLGQAQALPPEDVTSEGNRLVDATDYVVIKARGYKPAAMTIDAQAGKKIFDKNGCTHCHSVQGDGGYLGPMLDGIGAFRRRKFLIDRLSGVSETKPFDTGLMNHVKLDSTDARLISEYLLTLPEPHNLVVGGHPRAAAADNKRPQGFHFVPAEKSASSEEGKAIYQQYACVACHEISGHGGHLGPALDGVGSRRSRDYIAARVMGGSIDIAEFPSKDSRTVYKMPPFKLQKDQVDKLVDYLMTLPQHH